MIVELPDDVRRRTTKCAYGFGCLETGCCGNREMCEVVGSFGPEVLQLATHECADCMYRISFGYGQLCICPVRGHLHIIGCHRRS